MCLPPFVPISSAGRRRIPLLLLCRRLLLFAPLAPHFRPVSQHEAHDHPKRVSGGDEVPGDKTQDRADGQFPPHDKSLPHSALAASESGGRPVGLIERPPPETAMQLTPMPKRDESMPLTLRGRGDVMAQD